VGARERGSGQGVGDVVRCRRANVVDGGELLRVVARSSTRSTSMSSTTPIIDTAGMPVVNPIARAPSATSAASTMASVRGSATL
jgi:hypothetical protein